MFVDETVLVTGGAGFIGSHIVDRLVGLGAHVRVVDNLSTGVREFVNSQADFLRADLLDVPQLENAMRGVDFVFHIAANADIKDGLKHPRRDVEQNIVATQNVLEAMRASNVRRIAFSSTGAVYGEPAIFPTPEDAPFPVQTSLYATSKVAAEGLLASYAAGFGFSATILRFVSVLGPRYTHGHVFDFWRRLRADPTTLHVLGNGRQMKSYCHVDDCLDGVFAAIARPQGDGVGIFNVGRPDMLEVRESVKIICAELGLSPTVEYEDQDRGWVGDSPKILLDTTRLERLGWRPTRTLRESILDTLRYLERHPELAGPR